jgi:hypothetical protein
VTKGARRRTPIAPRARTLRTEQRAPPAPDVLPGFRCRTPDRRTALADGIASGLTWSFRHDRLAGTDPLETAGRRCQMLLRKEVIQPHLPVRLPCYDFTPIAGPTFGSSLPKGLGH